jgi:hypothetical protein
MHDVCLFLCHIHLYHASTLWMLALGYLVLNQHV